MTNDLDEIVEEYLKSVKSHLKGVSASQRAELLSELRSHISQLRADENVDSESGIRNILDQLGSPEAVAAAARDEEDTARGDRRPASRLKLVLVCCAVTAVVLFMAACAWSGLFLASSSQSGGATSETGRPVPETPGTVTISVSPSPAGHG